MKGPLLAGLGIGLPMVLLFVGQVVWRASPEPAVPPDRAAAEPLVDPVPVSSPSEPSVPLPAVETPAPSSPGLIDLLAYCVEDLQQRAGQLPEVQQKRAAAHLVHGRYDQAEKAFDRLLVREPDNPVVMLGKALALSGLGRPADAMPLFERVLEDWPDDVVTRFNYAVCLTRVNEHAAAVRELKVVLQQHPQHVRARFNLAVLHQAAHRPQHAIALWRSLTDQAPADETLTPALLSKAWFHRGELAMALHLNDEAERCFLRVIETDKNDVAAWCNLGIARAAAGQRDEAIVALFEALRRDADFVPAINQLALIHAANYRDTGNLASCRQAVKLCKHSLMILPNQTHIRALRDTLQSNDPQSPFFKNIAPEASVKKPRKNREGTK